MIIGMTADLHTMVHRYKKEHLDDIEKALDFFILECKNRHVDCAFILGDMFEQKISVATEALVRINKKISELSEVTHVCIIPGNHDMAYYSHPEINLANNYRHFANVELINEPKYLLLDDVYCLAMPYTKNPEAVYAKENVVEEMTGMAPRPVILCSHFGVKGFTLNPLCESAADKDDDAVAPKSLDHFKRVFLGHYHGHQSNGKITYVSAPTQHRHGDEHMPHGFVFYDTTSDEETFVPYEHGPRYMTVEFTKEGIAAAAAASGCHLRVKVNKRPSAEMMVKTRMVLAKKHKTVYFDESNAESNKTKLVALEQFKTSGFKDISTLLNGYLKRLEALNQLPGDVTVTGLSEKIKLIENA